MRSADTLLAPQSAEAEEMVLGSILIDPRTLADVGAFLRPADFFLARHQWIFEAMLAVHERGEAIDNLTVAEELRRCGRLENVGGSAYFARLIAMTPTAAHAETYGRIIEKAAIRRRLLAASGEIAQVALEENAEIDTVIERAEAALFGVTEQRARGALVSMREAASRYFDEVEDRVKNNGKIGLPTGFIDLDRQLGGLRKGSLNLLAGRPGTGKTALALNIAVNVTKRYQRRAAFFSLEMDRSELLDRVYSAELGVDSQALQMGQLDDRQWVALTELSNRVGAWALWIDDSPETTVGQIRARCKRLAYEQGLDLIIVDYLQLMLSEKNVENRAQEVATISRGLKILAKQLQVPVLALAQLNRAVEARADKRPILSDLRESGSLESDADLVMFLYRDDLYYRDSERQNQCDIIIAKNRKGPTGVVTLYFHKELTRFDNMQRKVP